MSWFEHGTSRIYYEEAGTGDPVLLLPGFTDQITNHTALRDAIVPHYRVIAADLPGSGRSEPQPRQYTAGYFREDADAFIALLQQVAGAPAHLIGHSDGGEVALLMAAVAPNIARSVLTWGSAGFISDPTGAARNFFHDVVDNPTPTSEGYRDYLIANYGEENARATTHSFVAALTAIIEAGGDVTRGRADAIACPVLLVTGENDAWNPKALLDDLASHISVAEVIEVEGAGHGVHQDRPEWFIQMAIDWLAKH